MGRESLAFSTTPPAAAPPAKSAAAATALAPGFRFHPTDEELVSYYLKRKVLQKPVRFNAIGEVDIYKHEPWELAVYSRLKTRDQEWYFFSALDKKYGNGARMNRATNKGYWKATGKDREIRRDSQLLGMKKTLVFHSGRAPDGLRTNWVMHEYRLTDYEAETIGSQDAYVLCRVFHKNNIGPPSGNRYAPFLEEEWDEGEMTMIPGAYVPQPKAADVNANGSNKIEQEFRSNNKNLININELPRESRKDDQLKRHPRVGSQHQEKQVSEPSLEHDNTCKPSKSFFKRERSDEEEEEDCQPLCVLNKEAPLPVIQYKRRRQNDSNASSRSTQDHCSSTTTADTTLTSPAATTAISALLEFSLMGSVERKEEPPCQNDDRNENGSHHAEGSMPPTCVKLMSELQKEIHQMAVERETYKLEMMSAEAMISILQSRIDALRQENEELRISKGVTDQ